jgi:hypothetical protein
VLLLFLVGIVPAIGFARVVYRLHDAADTARWLERAVDRWESRRLTVADRVNGPAYRRNPESEPEVEAASTEAPSNEKRATLTLPSSDSKEGEPLFCYLHSISNATLTPSPDTSGIAFTAGQDYLRTLLTWTPSGARDESKRSPVTMTSDFQLQKAPHEMEHSPALSASLLSTGLGTWSWLKTIIGIGILLATALALCWTILRVRAEDPSSGMNQAIRRNRGQARPVNSQSGFRLHPRGKCKRVFQRLTG